MEAIEPDGMADATRIGYSHATVANGTLYASGQVGWDESFTALDGIDAQCRQAFENVSTLLAEVDRTLDDVAKVTAHVVEMAENREPFLEVWRETFTEQPYPALTLLGPSSLARGDLLVELEVEVPVDG